MKRLGKQYVAAALALAAALCSGCGNSEYQRRMAVGVQKRKENSDFDKLLYGVTNLAGTRAAVRVPKIFKQSFVEGSAIKGKAVDKRRVKPAFPELTALNITYEAIAPVKEGNAGYYCYLGATDVAGKGGDTGDSMLGDLKEKYPENTSEWEEVQYPTPEGRSMTWRKCRATWSQEFYVKGKDGKETFKKMPGILELYVHQDGDYLVMMGWRVPTALEKSTGFTNLAALMAGAVVVKAKKK